MASRPLLPVPAWLLGADLLAALVLGLGLLLHFDPALSGRFGLPAQAGRVLAGFGALGLLACGFALVRHVAGRRRATRRLPH